MGILFSIPEIIAAASIGGAEAVEIAGGIGAILTGEGLSALEALQASAFLTGETAALGVGEEASFLLAAAPELTQTLLAVQGALSALTAVGGTVYTANPGELLYKAVEGPGGLGPRVATAPMALQLWLPQAWPWGGQGGGIPDWLLDLLREVPPPQEIIRNILQGIWTSYYRTGREIVQRRLATEISSILTNVRQRMIEGLVNVAENPPDPVQGLFRLINFAIEHQREWEVQAIAQGRPLFGGLVIDSSNLPVQGYNNMRGGFHSEGMWVSWAGQQGNTDQYNLPSWILFVLEELEKEVKTPKHALSQKRKWPTSKTAPTSKKRRR